MQQQKIRDVDGAMGVVSIVKPYMNMALFVSSIQLSSRLLINMYKHLLVNTIKFTLIYVLASRFAGVVVTASVISSGRCDDGQYSNSISGLSDCTIYQWCINGKAVYQQCSLGLYWNPDSKLCDWPEYANCPFENGKFAFKISESKYKKMYFNIYSIYLEPTSAPNRSSSTIRTTTSTAPIASPKPSRPPIVTSRRHKPSPSPTTLTGASTNQGKENTDRAMLMYLCTYVLFGLATLDPIQLTMKVFDFWSDTDEKGPRLYAQVTALKASGVKVLIALGGWNDSLVSFPWERY